MVSTSMDAATSQGRPIPLESTSKKEIKKHAAKAWFTLKVMGAEDLLEAFGLSEFCEGKKMSETLGEAYLKDRGGDVTRYHRHLATGQRVGQAFFNALSEKDQAVLRGHDKDPFEARSPQAVEIAIDFLLSLEGK